jgi:energy-coupling factor transporter ATP-binding protein EcfA2
MIERIKLKFGSSIGRSALEFSPTAITIIIGPNNSGKSKLIEEIAAQCTKGQMVPSDVVLERLTFSAFDQDTADVLLKILEADAPSDKGVIQGHISVRHRGTFTQMPRDAIKRALIDPNNLQNRSSFARAYASQKTIILNGKNRITLADEQDGGDLQQPAASTLQHLFKDDDLRKRYRGIVHKSFDSYVTIDPTKLGKLRLRLSPEEPASPELERGLSTASLAFHANAQLIQHASDGAKAFTGVLAEVMAGDPDVLLMDEPEAFLHPALAFNMGREIARSLAATEKRMFVSTHSAQFMMGCIQSGVPLNIVRLTYRGGVPTARLLPSNDIKRLMRNPLLRSAGVLSALFYENVVVTEGDADRAFYQEINERLQAEGRGIPNCVFLNAQNKQTVPFILEPLRALGIPAAAIYDLDFVKDGGGVAMRFLQTAGIPPLQYAGITALKNAVLKALNEADTAWKTKGGIDLLRGPNRAAADNYFDQLGAYGLFVVRGGELEAWLRHMSIGGHGPTWLIPMFEAMGEDPDATGYIKPTAGDVWAFLDGIAAWLLDPNRKGIPD